MTTFGDQVYQYGGAPVNGKMTTGSVFFVSSVTGSDGNTGKKPSQAFATLDKATNACTANKNDIVYIMPNHAETISGATSWVPDVAGVQYIGIGLGADAPELTFSATGSTLNIAGGNNLFQNIRFIAGISAITTGMTVAAHHVTFDNCVWDFSTTDFDFLIMLYNFGYDYMTVQNCRFIMENADGQQSARGNVAIQFEETDHMVLRNNIFTGDYAVSVINSTDSGASKSIMILDNQIYNDDTAAATSGGIDIDNASTGMIARNMIAWLCKAANRDITVDPGSCLMYENYMACIIDQYGISSMAGAAAST